MNKNAVAKIPKDHTGCDLLFYRLHAGSFVLLTLVTIPVAMGLFYPFGLVDTGLIVAGCLFLFYFFLSPWTLQKTYRTKSMKARITALFPIASLPLLATVIISLLLIDSRMNASSSSILEIAMFVIFGGGALATLVCSCGTLVDAQLSKVKSIKTLGCHQSHGASALVAERLDATG